MSFKRLVLPFYLFFFLTALQARDFQNIHSAFDKSPKWYGSLESMNVVDNVLLLQHTNGGWPKNINFYENILSKAEKEKYRKIKKSVWETTIDNNATFSEMIFLAKMYQATKNKVYKASFLKGLDFLYSLQYKNGGFKMFTRKVGYYTHITYNDDAMFNVMYLLREIAAGNPLFAGIVDTFQINQAQKSFDKGIDCILNTQYIQNGKRTVWCAQHDEITLLPAKARSYELPSLSGAESVGLVQLLMDIPNPSPIIKESILGAINWFEENRIKDHRLQSIVNMDGKHDLIWIESSEGDDLWGRFNELETNRPFVSDRNGVIKYTISEIGYERRTGYRWYVSNPLTILNQFKEWKKRNLAE